MIIFCSMASLYCETIPDPCRLSTRVFVCSEKLLPSMSLPIKRIAISIAIRLLRRTFGGDILTGLSILISWVVSNMCAGWAKASAASKEGMRAIQPTPLIEVGGDLRQNVEGAKPHAKLCKLQPSRRAKS